MSSRLPGLVLAPLSVGFLLLGLFMLVGPAGHIPLLDANRQPLAETEAEGYCAGVVTEATNYSRAGDPNKMEACLASSKLSTETNLAIVLPAFCVPISLPNCMEQVTAYMVWPTLTGGWTSSWNRAFPFPLESFSQGTVVSESRTGDRVDFGREGNSR